MLKKFGSDKKILVCAAVFALTVPLGACGKEPDQSTAPEPDSRYLPFAIKFDLEGKPVLVDANGDVIKPEVLQYPIKTTTIERVDSVVLVQATGSHFKVIKVNNREYKIPLPH